MVTRRGELEAIGGFETLADYLADDYQLGRLIASRKKQIRLSTVVVDCWSDPMDWRQVWSHQLRWARTIRICQPLPYFFSVLSNATLWPLFHSFPNRVVIDEATWSKRKGEWVPSTADGDFIASLMKPVTEIGEYAPWISAPKVGIDNKPGDFEYVKIET
jgi:hypothetical protein